MTKKLFIAGQNILAQDETRDSHHHQRHHHQDHHQHHLDQPAHKMECESTLLPTANNPNLCHRHPRREQHSNLGSPKVVGKFYLTKYIISRWYQLLCKKVNMHLFGFTPGFSLRVPALVRSRIFSSRPLYYNLGIKNIRKTKSKSIVFRNSSN